MPVFVTYLAALLTPVIGISTVVIAYRQWRTARDKLKLELFDRRLAVYEEVRFCLHHLYQHGETDHIIEQRFLRAIQPAAWLYDEEFARYLREELWTSLCDLGAHQGELDSLPVGDERSKRVRAISDLKKWFVMQAAELDRRVGHFLTLRH